MAEAHLAFFDLEMTGLDPEHDEIVQLGVVREKNGQICDQLEVQLRTNVPMDPNAQALHRLTRNPEGSVTFAEVLPRLRAILSDAVPIAHGAELDFVFLQRAVMSCDGPPLIEHLIDTVVLARRAIAAPSYTLSSISRALGLPERRWHSALEDATGVRALWHRLVPEFAPTSARDLWEVRIGQRTRVRVRESIATTIESLCREGRRGVLVVRSRGHSAVRVAGNVTRWREPYVWMADGHAVRVVRADRVLRIETA